IAVGDDERLRTAGERLAMLDVQAIKSGVFRTTPLDIQLQHDRAFDVQNITRDFYRAYDRIFKRVEGMLEGFDEKSKDKDKVREEHERRRLYTQRLFNRLMFIAFLQKKRWLRFSGQHDYLNALWKDYQQTKTDKTKFYSARLKQLFFAALGHSSEVNVIAVDRSTRSEVGHVPYLNGGLFEEGVEERDAGIVVPDDAVEAILRELFDQFNFTVTESTPLDQEVAVDPEMLSRVFEELVTGRNETGSYYTPKPVVSFMCKESLKGYLGDRYQKLVDEHEPAKISVPEARQLLARLADIRVVDPACGSGAYLLGMLHELHALVRLLDTRVSQETARDDYNRKLKIITNNLYGVDKDEFAVEIARLRLWLSLAVESEGVEPEPLPNLDLRVVCGDSLIAPSPEASGRFEFIESVIREYQQKKAAYAQAHHGEKITLHRQVEHLREKLRRARGNENVKGFDSAIEFAEVFASGHGPFTEQTTRELAGFDIVLANPPYGARVEDEVRDLYFDRTSEGAQSKDPYGLFIARGLQLLATGGQLCYIVSDTWRTIRSHKPLRKRLAEETTIKHVLDLPVWIFDATVNTCILTLTKQPALEGHRFVAGDLRSIANDDWESLMKNLLAVAEHGMDVQTTEYSRYTFPQNVISTYDNYSFFVSSPRLYKLMSDPRSTKLGNIADVKQGLATGDNQYYLRKRPGARGNYQLLDEDKLLPDQEIACLSSSEKLVGVEPTKYGGRHYVPYDKGGEGDAEGGWLPNYYVPTQYFIDWSKSAVTRLKTNTSEQQAGRVAARFQNSDYYFRQGLTWSDAGFYSPTFRLSGVGVFDVKGSRLIPKHLDNRVVLALLGSTLVRCLIKTMCNHTVSTQVDDLREVPIPPIASHVEQALSRLVERIIEKQKLDLRYPYHLHEQKEIDRLVYQLYELSEEDIREVELWYCRRYARLAEAQGLMREVKAKYADESSVGSGQCLHAEGVTETVARSKSFTLRVLRGVVSGTIANSDRPGRYGSRF
ncbi:MAG TPA: N-6 DNA methylase, partial [Pyrinomonadaceae bacterium]|nr:N-6 DNA methylase [Pyrinomonadaceae bacterium]